jgi:hypothetical protein
LENFICQRKKQKPIPKAKGQIQKEVISDLKGGHQIFCKKRYGSQDD